MERRRFLALTGALTTTTLAGCSGDDPQSVGGGKTADPTSTTTQTSSGTANDVVTTEPAEPQTPTNTATPAGQAQVNITNDELVVQEGEYSTEVYVAATVKNEGTARSGPIKITAEWYDAEGNYLDNDGQYLQTLGAGETWAARVYALVDAEKIEDYAAKGKFSSESPNFSPEGLSLTGSEMKVGDGEVIVSGTVKNGTGGTASYIQATGTVYNSDGVVLGDNWTNTSDVPAGRSWKFETSWLARDRASEADSHKVFITDSAF